MPTKAPTPLLGDEDGLLESLDHDLGAQAEIAPGQPRAGFAEQQGANVLLLMGMTVFVMAWVSFFAGHTAIGPVLLASSLVTVVIATGLARLEVLELKIFKLFDFQARFRQSEVAIRRRHSR